MQPAAGLSAPGGNSAGQQNPKLIPEPSTGKESYYNHIRILFRKEITGNYLVLHHIEMCKAGVIKIPRFSRVRLVIIVV